MNQDLAPAELIDWLPYIAFLRQEGANDWRVTNCGDELRRWFGYDPVNTLLSEQADAETHAYWINNFLMLVDDNRPFLERYSLAFLDKSFVRVKNLNLPIRSHADGPVDAAFVALTFDYVDG